MRVFLEKTHTNLKGILCRKYDTSVQETKTEYIVVEDRLLRGVVMDVVLMDGGKDND